MKFVIVYISPNGTTEITAKKIKDQLEKRSHSVQCFNLGKSEIRENPEPVLKALGEADISGWGSPAYHMDMLPAVGDFLSLCKLRDKKTGSSNKERDRGRKTFFFVNYGGITTGKSFFNAAKKFSRAGFQVIAGIRIKAPHFHHQESFPTQDTEKIIELFCSKIDRGEFSEISDKDIKKVFAPEKRLVSVISPFVHLVGKFRELPIQIDHEKCRKCSRCIRECPTGALNLSPELFRDRSLCLHCYHCVKTCPFGAVTSPIEKLDKMINTNIKIIGREHPPDKIYSLKALPFRSKEETE